MVNPSRIVRTDKRQGGTRDTLLDVAERHFAMYGFAGASLRGIIKDAKVNVAAVAYHFGDKEELYSAVIERFAVPVVTEQLNRLEAELAHNNVRLENILRSFYGPPITMIKQQREKGKTLSLFLGRAQTETGPVYSLVDSHFSSCRNRFIHAFSLVLPDRSVSDYQWYFEFMLSLIVCFLTRQEPIRRRYEDSEDWDADAAIERMVTFCAGGMKSLSTN